MPSGSLRSLKQLTQFLISVEEVYCKRHVRRVGRNSCVVCVVRGVRGVRVFEVCVVCGVRGVRGVPKVCHKKAYAVSELVEKQDLDQSSRISLR